jgi:hypothetical protein
MKSPGNKEKSRLFTDESVDFVVIVLFWLPGRFAWPGITTRTVSAVDHEERTELALLLSAAKRAASLAPKENP